MKQITWAFGRSFGVLIRMLLRYLFLHPLIRLHYKVAIEGGDQALSTKKVGAIVVCNHISRLDGPLVVSEAWPYSRIRPTVWHAEYNRWFQWPFMKLFGAICMGSPRHLPQEERERKKAKAITKMEEALKLNRHLLIFAEGSIGDGSRVTIKPHLSGVYSQIEAHPEKPVLLVELKGLEYSLFGKRGSWRNLFKRLPVKITITRVHNVSLLGGPEGLNSRIENFYNYGIPLATNEKGA